MGAVGWVILCLDLVGEAEVWSRYSRKEPIVVGYSGSAPCYFCRWKGEKQCVPQGPVEFMLGQEPGVGNSKAGV